jgi:predicted GNAT family acetyltransferase
MTDTPLTIVHNVDQHRFEASLGDEIARADYRLADGAMRITHTGVPRAFEGRGIAASLVRSLMSYARENGLRVVPYCPYAVSYMKRHPDTHDLLPEGFEL